REIYSLKNNYKYRFFRLIIKIINTFYIFYGGFISRRDHHYPFKYIFSDQKSGYCQHSAITTY
ncbi:hypothetical protein, partial [Lactiplantibacillus plantarum]|uniref:hypothetical protein n=1 Tax=Lactiplantibacillus plantarum TaxID=1590 RepID=UPI001C9E285E